MLFAIDDPQDTYEVSRIGENCKDDMILSPILDDYKFCHVKHATEEEMFAYFKKNLFISESIKSLSGRPVKVNIGSSRMMNPKTFTPYPQRERKYSFPTHGCYVIPKLFGYFPFLDCDNEQTYEDAKFHLNLEDIPYQTYTSSYTNKHWIFCDKQMPFDQTLAFIESFPHDHRYTWISGHKKEFVIRAIPKSNKNPMKHESNLLNSFTDDFKFWIKKFDGYWEKNLISDFMMTLQTLECI